MGLWKWLVDMYEADCRKVAAGRRVSRHGALLQWIAQIESGRCFKCGGNMVRGANEGVLLVCCENQYCRCDIGLAGNNNCVNIADYSQLVGEAYAFNETLPSLTHLQEFTPPDRSGQGR